MANELPVGGVTIDQVQPEYRQWFIDAAQRHNVPLTFLLNIYGAESSLGTNIANSPVARGIMQIGDTTAQRYGINNRDPQSSIFGAARLFGQYIDRYRDPYLAAIAYNAGEGDPNDVNTRRGLLAYQTGGWGALREETLRYVDNVMRGVGPSPVGLRDEIARRLYGMPEAGGTVFDVPLPPPRQYDPNEGWHGDTGEEIGPNPTAGQRSESFFPLTQEQAGWLTGDRRTTWNQEANSWGTWGEPNLPFTSLSQEQAGWLEGDPRRMWDAHRDSWGVWGPTESVTSGPPGNAGTDVLGGVADPGNYNPIWYPAGGGWGEFGPSGVSGDAGWAELQASGNPNNWIYNPATLQWGSFAGGLNDPLQDYNRWYEDVMGGRTAAPEGEINPTGTLTATPEYQHYFDTSGIRPGTPFGSVDVATGLFNSAYSGMGAGYRGGVPGAVNSYGQPSVNQQIDNTSAQQAAWNAAQVAAFNQQQALQNQQNIGPIYTGPSGITSTQTIGGPNIINYG